MKITIHYKSDHSLVPYCAYTTWQGSYLTAWSDKSFEDAKNKLLGELRRKPPIPPVPEEVEI